MTTDARLLVLIQYFTDRLDIETDPVVRAWLRRRLGEIKAKEQS